MASGAAATSSLTSTEPVGAMKPDPSPKERPVATFHAGTALTSASANIDQFLEHLHRCLRTPAGIDCVLQFSCYTSRLSAAILNAVSQNALRRAARLTVASAISPPPLVAAPSTPTGLAPAVMTLLAARRLKALSGVLSEARVIMRLWGLLGMYLWARRLFLKLRQRPNADTDKASPPRMYAGIALQLAQLATSVMFQALENGAFLSSKGVLGWSPASQARAMRWSSRFWGAFVGMELGRLVFEAVRGGGDVRTAEWRKTVTRYVAWSPLIIHWSSETPLMPEIGIGLLACIPSVIQMRDLWADTARES